MRKYIDYIKKYKLGEIYCNKTFKDITTIKIGGKIKLLYYPNTIGNFIHFYKYYLIDKKYPLIIIGNGSNILANSSEYNGIVISLKKIIYKYILYNDIIIVNSGVMINDLIHFSKRNNLGGLEKLYCIPATVGGLIKMNGSAYDLAISDQLISIKIINDKGEIKVLKKEDIQFQYRKTNIPNNYIIIECTFKLNKTKKEHIDEQLKKIINDRKAKQPLNEFNAGSTFKNPINYPAWKLINDVGLRGYSVNDAHISQKHCNFLINKNNCTSDDMIILINKIKEEVFKKYNIILECEWIFINFKKTISFF